MNIEITTLTPVHIGTGRQFQGNTDYLYFQETKGIAIIDEHKVLDIIGTENVDQWVQIIKRKESLMAYLKARKPNLQATDTACRILLLRDQPPTPQNTIKEHIHSGIGNPLLPGSSLKGAIRTAYFAREIAENYKLLDKNDILHLHNNNPQSKQREVRNKNKIVDSELTYHLIGKNPNHDYFRLLRLGDLTFRRTECILLQTLNETEFGFKIKKQVNQHVECIPEGETTFGRLHVPEKLRQLTLNKKVFPEKVAGRFTKEDLIFTINQHTRKLLKDEIAKWEKEVMPESIANYLEELKYIKSVAEQCDDTACVLRVGHGSGFRFMTGDWHEELNDELYEKLMNKLQKSFHKKFEFPKSRRLGYGGIPLGFIKLTFLSKEEHKQRLAKAARKELEAENCVRIQQQDAALAKEKERKRKEAEEEAMRKADEEAKEPEYFPAKIRKGDVLDAFYIGISNPMNPKRKKFKLLIEKPGKEQVVILSYFADLDKNTLHQVMVTDISKKGIIQSVQYIKKK